jgi:hypothetical protein
MQLANFLQIQEHHQSTNRTQHIASQCCHLMRVFLDYSLQTFTKYKMLINQPMATHRIAVLSYHVCVFALQLANFYKYKSITTQPTERSTSP